MAQVIELLPMKPEDLVVVGEGRGKGGTEWKGKKKFIWNIF